jgi:hypothetical protein
MTSTAVAFTVDPEEVLAYDTSREMLSEDGSGPSVDLSPSPFHIPAWVEVTVTSSDECVFGFSYPNQEPGERIWQQIADNSGVEVQLAQRSKKILAIRFTSALDRLTSNTLSFDASTASRWCAEMPESARFACRANAGIVSRLLADMPSSIRTTLARGLRELSGDR